MHKNKVIRWLGRQIFSAVFQPLLVGIIGVLLSSFASAILLHWKLAPEKWKFFCYGSLFGFIAFDLFLLVILYVEYHKVLVELTPSSGPSPELFLTVRNLRRTRTFSAQCTMVSRTNDQNPLWHGTFDLYWYHRDYTRVRIEKGHSKTLLVARCHLHAANQLPGMFFPGRSPSGEKDFEWSVWIKSPNTKLPEYTVDIQIFGKGCSRPFTSRFVVRPAKYSGPLEMFSVKR